MSENWHNYKRWYCYAQMFHASNNRIVFYPIAEAHPFFQEGTVASTLNQTPLHLTPNTHAHALTHALSFSNSRRSLCFQYAGCMLISSCRPKTYPVSNTAIEYRIASFFLAYLLKVMVYNVEYCQSERIRNTISFHYFARLCLGVAVMLEWYSAGRSER